MQRINPHNFAPSTTTAVQAVCAWPNLTLLPTGQIIAAIFNQSCHGLWEGDLDAYVSIDQGVSWQFQGRIAPFDPPGTNRMNCAAGLAKNNDLIALCAGWTGRGAKGQRGKPYTECPRLTARVYRSVNLGQTWTCGSELACPTHGPLVPFGDIHIDPTSPRLLATAYAQRANNGPYLTYLIASHDDGHTWAIASLLNEKGNETALLPLLSPANSLLAASREEHDNHVEQFISPDNGNTWNRIAPLTHPGQVTSHLLRLKDNRILLSYGNRCINNFGIDVRTSSDEGQSWSAPIRIADCPLRDCGYPATIQLPDNSLLTAFYTQLPGYGQYEMRTTKWSLPQ
jgi:hypothetical protein